jgi:endoglucanase
MSLRRGTIRRAQTRNPGDTMRTPGKLTVTLLFAFALVPATAAAAEWALVGAEAISADTVRIGFSGPSTPPEEVEKAGLWRIESEPARRVVAAGRASTPVDRDMRRWPPVPIARHDVFLSVNPPLDPGQSVVFVAPGLLGQARAALTWDPTKESRAVKVHQLGFAPDEPRKVAFAGDFLGTMGPLRLDAPAFEVTELASGRAVFSGTMRRVPAPLWLYGQEIWQADFGPLQEPGEYAISVEGVGRSPAFRIGEGVYDPAMWAAVRAFSHHRCGMALDASWADYARPACHLGGTDACFHKGFARTALATASERGGKCIDAHGGWHDASDYGKYTGPASVALFYLLYAWEHWPALRGDGLFGIPESGDGRSDLLSEAAWGLDWMLRMQGPDGGVYHKATSQAWGTEDAPESDRRQKLLADKTTHATARFAAVMARGARVFREVDAKRARRYEGAARKAWKLLGKHPGAVPDPGFSNRDWTGGGEYGDRFGDADERAWAAAEWMGLLGEADPAMEALVHKGVPRPIEPRVPPLQVRDWPPPNEDAWRFALLAYAELRHPGRDEALQAAIREAWRLRVNQHRSYAREEPFGLSFTVERGQNFGFGHMNGARWAMEAAIAESVLAEPSSASREASLANLGVLFGANPLGRSWVTGLGSRGPLSIEYAPDHHRGGAPLSGHPVDGPTTSMHGSNRAAEGVVFPTWEEYPPALRYFDIPDPVMNEPTLMEMAELVIALAPHFSGAPRPDAQADRSLRGPASLPTR